MANSGDCTSASVNQLGEQSPDFGKMAENFCDAYHGKVFGIDDCLAPRARMRSPPAPKNSREESRRRKASMSCAPYISPEASPAEMRIFANRILCCHCKGGD